MGSRFHALVAALSQGIPVAALGWSHKYAELLGEFGLREFVFRHDLLDDADVQRGIRRLIRERDSLAIAVQAALPEILRRVDAVFDETACAISGDRLRQIA